MLHAILVCVFVSLTALKILIEFRLNLCLSYLYVQISAYLLFVRDLFDERINYFNFNSTHLSLQC